ncbi:hypothetical protein Talka_00444 [Tepidimonas alkaliphilus]|uniref:Uncharacterized protein n=1 Tax=Tepidimonas alkaliphilus TaxID=2588942 RepID=A0A554WB38_9BURK|nr:hypothetical protein [Tepidimonas alkaliphilus]TSE20781.1 hypothetical protein Talka_00444 [Tepidimonas alkaliphilus]
MLEAGGWLRDQAAGLAAWRLQPPLRVVALVEQPGSSALASRLQAGWAALGLSCGAVAAAPPLWDEAPAADVWLWRADAQVLARWWPREGGAPLVPLLAQPTSLVEAYRALKTLRLASLSPLVLALAQAPGEEPALQAALTALGRTCHQHLGWRPTVWTLGYYEGPLPQREAQADASMAAQVLETAWLLEARALGPERRPSAAC